jgi:hypothetical protein
MKTLRLELKTAFALLLASSTLATAQTPQSSDDCPSDAIPGDCPNAPQAAPPPQPAPVAEPAPEPLPPQPQPYVVQEEEYEKDLYGISLTLGGGVDDFVESDFRDLTDTGGSWNVRAAYGTNSYVAVEGSYIGSAQGIDTFGLDTDAILVGNGAQAALRLNVTRDYPAQPFVYGGLAWRHYSLTNTDFNTSDVSDSDDVLEIPVGLGIAGKFYGFTVDARGEYRFATDDDLVITADDNFDGMDRWGVMANIGYEM